LQIYKKKFKYSNFHFTFAAFFCYFKMLIISKKSDLIDAISAYREQNKQSVGFVPTMGFLHSGHGSLIEKSIRENGLTVCDIFVNPLQFNDKKDFEKYPVDIERDKNYLEQLGCDILYIPLHSELYPNGHQPMTYDFGELESFMEGRFRAGHFQGMAEVVRILFEIVKPDKAYFGEKDFQQLKIIQHLVKQFQMPIEIVPCEIIREDDGLAMSSRNARLSPQQRNQASFIFRQLTWCTQNYKNYSPPQLQKLITEKFEKNSCFKLEYVEFADRETLKSINSWNECSSAGVFIAAFLGDVRLIDNIILF